MSLNIRYFVYSLVTLTIILCGTVYWLCFTTSGAAFIVDFIDSQVDEISIGSVNGTLADRLHLDRIQVTNATINVDARDTSLQIDPFALWLFRLNLYELDIGRLNVDLPETPTDKSAEGGDLYVPVTVNLMDASIQDFTVTSETFSHDVHDIRFAGSLSAAALRLNHFTARDDTFTVTTELKLALAPAWTFTSMYHLRNHNTEAFNGQTLSIRGEIQGDVNDMLIQGMVDDPQRIHYKARITNLDETPRGNITLSADNLDLNPFLSRPWRLTGTRVELSGTLDRYQITAQGGVLPPDVSTLSYELKASGDMDSLEIALASVGLDDASVSFEGRIGIAGERAVSGKIRAQAIPLSLVHQDLEGKVDAQGSVAWQQDSGATIDLDRIDGSLFNRRIDGQLRIAGTGIDDATVEGLLRLGTNALTMRTTPSRDYLSFKLDASDLNTLHPSLGGELQATGHADIKPPYSVTAEVAARNIPLSVVNPRLIGSVDFDSKLDWGQKEGYRIQLTKVDGSLFEREVSGHADFIGTDLADVQVDGELRLGDNHLQLSAEHGRGKYNFSLNAPRLGAFYPDISGDLRATGNVQLHPDNPVVQLQVRSEKLSLGEHSVAGLHIDIPEPSDNHLSASATWASWQYDQYNLGGLNADYEGTLESGQLHLLWQQPDANAEMTMTVRRNTSEISGQLHAGTVTVSENTWRSDHDISFEGSMTAASLHISPHCWRHKDSQVCFRQVDIQDTTTEVKTDLQRIPVKFENIAATLGNPDIPADLSLKTMADLAINARWQDASLDASFEAEFPQTELGWSDDEEPLRISFGSKGHIHNNRLDIVLESLDDSIHKFYVQVSIPDLQKPTKGEAQLQLNGNYVPFLTALVPPLSQGQGDLIANLRIDTGSGTPAVSGMIRIPPGASVAIPAAGIQVSDMELTAEAVNNDLLQFRGAATSGTGSVLLTGDIELPFSSNQEIHLSISGKEFQTMNTRDIRLVASSDLELKHSATDTSITGEVTLVDGVIRYNTLDTDIRSVSTDVTIDDAEAESSLLALANIDLRFRVADNLRIKGYGLDANIGGTLNLEQKPDSPPHAHGTLTLSNGTISRFGQTLIVEKGRLIYSGSLNNPTVDVVTSRTIRSGDTTVKVKLTFSGPANNIRSEISADPAMSEANALSWLMLGRPLMTASNEEGQDLSGVALALGLNKALPIAKEIGSTLGLDELDVSANGTDSVSILAGKRISQRLYVQYNYDVFSKIGGFLFNYSLTPHVSVEAQSGENQSLELIYTF